MKRSFAVFLTTAVLVIGTAIPVMAAPSLLSYTNCGTSTVHVSSLASGSVLHRHGGAYGWNYLDGSWYNSYLKVRQASTTENAITWRVNASGVLYDIPATYGYCVAGGPA